MKVSNELILGYPTYSIGLKSLINEILINIENRSSTACKWAACLNPHSYVMSLKDPKFSMALHTADWLIPDGVGICIASKLLNGNIRSRITGADLFLELMYELNGLGNKTVFFLGSTGETLKKIKSKVEIDFPNVKIVEMYSPPFKSELSQIDNDNIIYKLNLLSPDVIWVGMSAPKQEKWIYQNIDKINSKFIVGIGAVFDFYSGNINRSPLIYQILGLEWLPRLIQEPRRLWKRMFISAPIFICHILYYKIRLFIKKFYKSI